MPSDVRAPPPHEAGLIIADEVEIYREVRGEGLPVLFVQGALGDGGTFEPIAKLLDDEFRVITYDRRGNSRSPRPPGYSTMLLAEQADDAAAVIREAGSNWSLVFATSGGALIGLELLLRHSELVRGAVLHEPALLTALAESQFHEVPKRLTAALADGLNAGPEVIAEMFVRSGSGDATWERLEPELRRRLRGNGGLFAEAEFHAFASYQIDNNESASIRRPVILLAGTESAPFRRYICEWLAKHLNCEVASLPGGHMAYLDRPAESANVLRPIFRELAANTDSPTPRGSQTRPSEPEVSDGTSRYR